jgi:hypothetical protein
MNIQQLALHSYSLRCSKLLHSFRLLQKASALNSSSSLLGFAGSERRWWWWCRSSSQWG